jgi:hypothetical protein
MRMVDVAFVMAFIHVEARRGEARVSRGSRPSNSDDGDIV